MNGRWLVVLCFSLVAAIATADPTSTYNWMLQHQFIASAQTQNGVATVVIGVHFYNADAESQQNLCATLLSYLQGLDSTVQQYTLVDSSGQQVGVFAGGTLTLSNQPGQ